MCKMCESDNYDSLLELQTQSYFFKSVASAAENSLPSSSISPLLSDSIQYKDQSPREEEQCRRTSLSTCFGNLRIERAQTTTTTTTTTTTIPSMLHGRGSSIIAFPPNSPSPTSSLLSPPSSPKSTALPLMQVVEVNECECDEAEGDGSGKLDHEPCRRFQRQILSRLQVLSPHVLEHQHQQQDPRMLIIPHSNSLVSRGGDGTTDNAVHFTPPPSPDLYDQKQRRICNTNSVRPLGLSAPHSRKTSTSSISRPNRIRLPSLAELGLGISSSSMTLQKFNGNFSASSTPNSARRRVSSPNPLSHLGSRGGVRKVGCGRKSSIEILGDNTPFKSGWSFSTAYGSGK